MIDIVTVNKQSDYKKVAELADIIWREHYIPFIGKPQIDYMLGNIQSESAIENQVLDGFEYFLLHFNELPVGYISIKKKETTLFLSKIYILKEFRGKGIARETMQFIEKKAKNYQLNTISLGVNIHNTNTIKAYEALGFVKVNTLVTDIGNGFIMDDYVMEKALV